MRKKSNLRDSGCGTNGADDLLESAGVAFSKVLQKIEAKRSNVTWLAVPWMKLFPWWQRSEESVQRALSWRRRGDPPPLSEFQVRLLSVKHRKLQPHCPSLIHWCVSNWFLQRDNEFSVLKRSHQSSIHQSAPGMGWDYLWVEDVQTTTVLLLLCQQELLKAKWGPDQI